MYAGKKDIKEKGSRKEDVFADDFFDVNQLMVPKAIKEEIEQAGKDIRWINVSEFNRHGGVHRHRWEPYRPKNKQGIVGIQADGVLRRGDLILAVRSKEVSRAYRARVQKRNKANEIYNKAAAKEVRSRLTEGGVRTKVVDGYEDE